MANVTPLCVLEDGRVRPFSSGAGDTLVGGGGGGSQGLDDVLAVDPNTGANDIIVTSGQVIEGASELTLRANPGSTLRLQAGALIDTHIFELVSGNRVFSATPGGLMVIHAGDADMSDTSGEALFVRGGNANGNADGGALDFMSGAPDTGGAGGNISFTAADSVGTFGGGSISFTAGGGYGAGHINLTAPTGGPGGDGDINLNAGGGVNITATNGSISFSGTIGGTFAATQVQAGTGVDLTLGADATDFWTILSDGSLRALDASYVLQVSTIIPNSATSLHILNNGGGGTQLLLESDGTNPVTLRVNAIDYWRVSGTGEWEGRATGNTIRIRQGGATDNGGNLSVQAGPGGATSGNGGDLLLDGGTVTSGTAGVVTVRTAGTSRWTFNASGHLIGGADNSYDIGASGATRPRTGYFGTSFNVGNGITPSTDNGDVVAGDGTRTFQWDASAASVLVSGATSSFGTGSAHSLLLVTNTTERASVDSNGNVVVGTAALATNATDGFLYIPTCAGTPTGTPTSFTGRAPMVYDSSNDMFYIYSGGSWKGILLV